MSRRRLVEGSSRTRQLSVVAATGALALVLAASASAARVFLPTFSIVVPKDWVWRAFPGIDGTGAEFSNWGFAVRHGFDPDAGLPPGAFILWVNPFKQHGSMTRPTLERGDFMRLDDPARPRGHARADHSYCARGGRCFEISFEYGSTRVPERVLVAVNRALRSIRAAPLPRRRRPHTPRLRHPHRRAASLAATSQRSAYRRSS